MAALKLDPAASGPSVRDWLSAAFCCATAMSVVAVVVSVAAFAGAMD